jgi:hypothetical protein
MQFLMTFGLATLTPSWNREPENVQPKGAPMKLRPFVFLPASVAGILLLWNLSAHADSITLKDGSVLHGEILLYDRGVYTIKSDTLGTVTVNKSDIKSIDVAPQSDAKAADQGNASVQKQVEALQESMAKNPEVLKSINALQDDADIKEVLNDPELMKAVNSGDIATLMSSEKFMKLLNKQGIQEISKKVAP